MNHAGTRPHPKRIELPATEDGNAMRRFLDMVNYYRRFIPKAAKLETPLNKLLYGLRQKKASLNWDEAATTAFNDVKITLLEAVMLNYDECL